MYSAQDTLAGGLPHSEIPGSTIARISPGLFAACHVLHRLSVPRHPPDALHLRLSATPNGKNHPDIRKPDITGQTTGAANSSLRRHYGIPIAQPLGRTRSAFGETTVSPVAAVELAFHRIPLRSHNSLLYDGRQQRTPASQREPAEGKFYFMPRPENRVRSSDIRVQKSDLQRQPRRRRLQRP